MKLITKLSLGILCCGSLVAGGPASTTAPAVPAQESTIPEHGTGARTVQYGDKDVIAINSRLRFTTLIVLPKNERILDFVCGDKDFWVVNGTENFAYVKPAKANTRSNLNLITASGNVYSFVLQEVTNQPAIEPDLKVFVELRDASMLSAVSAAPKFVTAQTVDDYRQQVEMAKAETRQAHTTAEQTVEQNINKYREDYPTKALQFPYRFESRTKPFYVSAIFHDDKFTYIQASPQETPALYEVKDGKPNLIDFQFRNGTYIVPKILDSGYLTIGKAKLSFSKEGQ